MPVVPEDGEITARWVRVMGEVQGVWYRGWTCEEAIRRGLKGWVRNREDGSVEALFAGPAYIVMEMIHDCRIGPPAANVLYIESEIVEVPDLEGFEQRPTEKIKHRKW
jgi:acylphosphatase